MSVSKIPPPGIPPNAAYSWCKTDMKETKVYYVWSINKFSCLQEAEGEALNSSNFSAEDDDKSTWFLQLYPRGLDQEQYVSLFLHHIPKDESHEVTAEVEFSIIENNKQKTLNRKSSQAFKFTSQSFRFGFSDFVDRDNLLNGGNSLLHNGELKIFCEISVIKETFSVNGRNSAVRSKVFKSRLTEDLGKFLKDGTLSDIVLVAKKNGKALSAHKTILAARSAVLADIFQKVKSCSSMVYDERSSNYIGKGELKIFDVDIKTLTEMIRFMYIGQAPTMDEKLAADLLVCAEKFQFEELKELCERALSTALTSEKVFRLIPFATLHNATHLKTQLMKFLQSCEAHKIE